MTPGLAEEEDLRQRNLTMKDSRDEPSFEDSCSCSTPEPSVLNSCRLERPKNPSCSCASLETSCVSPRRPSSTHGGHYVLKCRGNHRHLGSTWWATSPSSFAAAVFLVIYASLAVSQRSAVLASLPCPKEGCLCVPRQVTCSGAGLTELPTNILFQDIETLSLVRNKIKKIPPNYFKKFKRLRRLYLDENAITDVAAHFLEGLPAGMETISVQQNKLRMLNPFSFGGIRDVGDISLGKNEIKAVREFAFAGTANVNMLILSGNPLKRLEGWAFSGLTDVNFLKLPQGISHISADAFHGLHRVGFMTLPGLNLTELRDYAFRELRNVSVFSVVDSYFADVSKNAFQGMKNIQNLEFFNNTFDGFSEIRINESNEVQTLKIEGNVFKGIGIPGRIHVAASRSLSFVRNTFPCDCRIFRVLRDQESQFEEFNYCNSPPEVAGMTIIEALNAMNVEECPEDVLFDAEEGGVEQLSMASSPGPTSSSSQFKASSAPALQLAAGFSSFRILCVVYLMSFLLGRGWI